MNYSLFFLFILIASCTVEHRAHQQEENVLEKEMETWLMEKNLPIKKKVPNLNPLEGQVDRRSNGELFPLIKIEIYPLRLEEWIGDEGDGGIDSCLETPPFPQNIYERCSGAAPG